jgi:hypothetical protein
MGDFLTLVAAKKMLEALLLTIEATNVQLHTGNPGPAGTENVAAENTRHGGAAGSWQVVGRVGSNKVAFEWVGVKAKETITYFTLWQGANLVGYGELKEPIPLEIGDTFKFPIGTLEVEPQET